MAAQHFPYKVLHSSCAVGTLLNITPGTAPAVCAAQGVDLQICQSGDYMSALDQDLLMLPEAARSAGRTARMRCLPGTRMPPTGLPTGQTPGQLHAGWPAQTAPRRMGACASWRAATRRPSCESMHQVAEGNQCPALPGWFC